MFTMANAQATDLKHRYSTCYQDEKWSCFGYRAGDDATYERKVESNRDQLESRLNLLVRERVPFTEGMRARINDGKLQIIRPLAGERSFDTFIDDDEVRVQYRIPLGL